MTPEDEPQVSAFMITSQDNDHLEARSLGDDDSMADSDSGYWATGESTHSVTSSIYDYENAHGRTYGRKPPLTLLNSLPADITLITVASITCPTIWMNK
jgi:hypothetical protein